MGKRKTKADLGKLVDAQAKGKNVKTVKSEGKRSSASEVDARQSKAQSLTPFC